MASSYLTCAAAAYPPTEKPCGMHGTCLGGDNGTVCLCDDGYSSIGDFSLVLANPCDIHVKTVQILWGISLVCAVVALVFAGWGIHSRRFGNVRNARQAPSVVALPVLLIVGVVIHLIIAIPKLVIPSQWVVGLSVGATLVFCLFTLLFAGFLTAIYFSIAKAAFKSKTNAVGAEVRAEAMSRLRNVQRLVAFLGVYFTFGSFFPLSLLSRPDLVFIVTGIFGVGIVAFPVAVLGVYVAPRYITDLIDTLNETMDRTHKIQTAGASEQLVRIRKKLRVARILARTLLPLMDVAVVLFSVWPYLVIKLAYFLPVAISVIQLLSAMLIWATTTNQWNVIKRPSLATIGKATSHLLSSGKGMITNYLPSPLLSSASSKELTASPPREVGETGEVVNDGRQSHGRGSKKKIVERDKSAKAGLQRILTDDRERFTEYVRAKHATEALKFYDFCVKYSNAISEQERKTLGPLIVEEHVAEAAPHPIDMPQEMRDEIMRALAEGRWEPNTFDKASSMAFDLLKTNFYHAYVRTTKAESLKLANEA